MDSAAWAAGIIARDGAVAGEEATAVDGDDEEADGGAENMDPTDTVPSGGGVMASWSTGTLRSAASEAGRSPALARPEEAALVMEAEAVKIGTGGGGG
jgi:hypothetical protein